MDLLEKLYDEISKANPPFHLSIGFLPAGKDVVCIYPLPGSRTTETYFDGTKEREMLYEIGFRTDDSEKANQTLWLITERLEEIESIVSDNNSFTFNSLEVSEMPFISEADEQGLSTYLLDLKVNIDQF